MENTSSPQPSADTAPNGSPADPVAALDLILGETEVERAAQKIIMLRGFSDLALREAGRLDRAATFAPIGSWKKPSVGVGILPAGGSAPNRGAPSAKQAVR